MLASTQNNCPPLADWPLLMRELGPARTKELVMACERFYPAFQLVAWGGETPEKALGIAMTEAYGRA